LAALTAAILVIGSLSVARWVLPASSGERLDLSKYVLTFSDEFDTLSVSASSPDTRWTAHTPYHGDFGDAGFRDPSPGFPFTIDNGILRIEARKGDDGKWSSGLLSSYSPSGSGFAQKYGYFEIRAKLPEGPGVWPAFWLGCATTVTPGSDPSGRYPEIDVLEFYGHDINGFQSVVQLWSKGKSVLSRLHNTRIPSRILVDNFNTYGVEIGPEWTVFYFNQVEIWRTNSEPEFAEPMYIMFNLALGGGWPIDKTPSPSYYYVDYVRAYARK
jgi:beta-glucanase (GH16 family)